LSPEDIRRSPNWEKDAVLIIDYAFRDRIDAEEVTLRANVLAILVSGGAMHGLSWPIHLTSEHLEPDEEEPSTFDGNFIGPALSALAENWGLTLNQFLNSDGWRVKEEVELEVGTWDGQPLLVTAYFLNRNQFKCKS